MHRAGPGERGGASYGRRAVATAKWAAIQISGVGKGLSLLLRTYRASVTRSIIAYGCSKVVKVRDEMQQSVT